MEQRLVAQGLKRLSAEFFSNNLTVNTFIIFIFDSPKHILNDGLKNIVSQNVYVSVLTQILIIIMIFIKK